MQRSRSWLTLTLFFGASLVLILFWPALSGTFLGFLYRNAAGFSTARSVTQIASVLTAVFLYLTAALIAVPVAFQKVSLANRLLNVIPLFFLVLTFVGIISNIAGIGATGTLVDLGNGVILNFSSTWVVVGLILSTIAVVVAAIRANLGLSIAKNAIRLVSIAGGLGVIAAAGLVATVLIVSTSQPTFGFPGGGPRPGNGNQGVPPIGTQPAQGTGQAGQRNGQPGAQGTEQATRRPASGAQEGLRPEGPGGGPGGGLGGLTRTFSIGGVVGVVAGLALLVSIIGAARSLSGLSSEALVPAVSQIIGKAWDQC